MDRYILIVSLATLLPSSPLADHFSGGEFRLQQQVLLTREHDTLEQAIGDSASILTSSLRLKTHGSGGAWSYDVHYVLEGLFSDDFANLPLQSTSTRNTNLLDLRTDTHRGRDGWLRHGLDRASIAYSTPKTVVRLGRQALTWGRGQVFQPLDLFNPFAPDAPDQSYKPGTDMIYGQYLFDNGADLQALVVPRRSAAAESTADASSAAIKGLLPVGNFEVETVLARDYGDTVVALGATAPMGDALWKLDVVSTTPQRAQTTVSAVANLNMSWTWQDKPVSGFLEYYRNGFGVADERPADELPSDLTQRMARGQIFTTGRDYINIGGTVHWTPLLQITPIVAVNLHDQSALSLLTAQYSLSNRSNLVISAQLPFGRRGSEYGGRRTTVGADDFERMPYTVNIRFERFF
ncbi:MAG: hypothetical protein AAGI72_16130 [Pseudomonadota bacterium]